MAEWVIVCQQFPSPTISMTFEWLAGSQSVFKAWCSPTLNCWRRCGLLLNSGNQQNCETLWRGRSCSMQFRVKSHPRLMEAAGHGINDNVHYIAMNALGVQLVTFRGILCEKQNSTLHVAWNVGGFYFLADMLWVTSSSNNEWPQIFYFINCIHPFSVSDAHLFQVRQHKKKPRRLYWSQCAWGWQGTLQRSHLGTI